MYTIHDFNQDFPTEEACFNFLVSQHTYPCPCGKEYKYRIQGTKLLSCTCGRQISPFTGTILEKSSTPLKTWLYALYLFSQSRHGVSAAELQRQLGVTYKCAWRMGHKIRSLMTEDNQMNTLYQKDHPMLEGTVEADEAYFGGDSRYDKKPNSFGRGTKKACMFGMVERDGRVRATVVEDVKGLTLMEYIACNIKTGSRLMTDEFKGYKWAIRHGLLHFRVNHKKRHYGYKKGPFNVNTNRIESFWSLFKNSVRGTHRWCSRKHLHRYLDERVFFYNHRRGKHPFLTLRERVMIDP